MLRVEPTRSTISPRSSTDRATRDKIVSHPDTATPPSPQWVVERLDINGEEIPIIRHVNTWLPARLAHRYVLRTRFAVGPAQLTTDMRAIAHLYDWSENDGGIGNLDTFLTAGKFLSQQQLQQLVRYLHCRHDADNNSSFNKRQDQYLVANQTYNTRLFAVQQFLKWAYEPTNHGGIAGCNHDEIMIQQLRMNSILDDEKLDVGESRRHEPLTFEALKLIIRAIGPNEFGEFPDDVFTESTRYRNWLMFMMALYLGPRKSELLTIKVEHLYKGSESHEIFIPRQQDDAGDPRTRRRLRGKTNERLVPLMDPDLLPWILKYLNANLSAGHRSPYLFLTEKGRPISNSTADYIIKQIGGYAERLLEIDDSIDANTRGRIKENIRKLSWHRLRVTWAEIAALRLYREHGYGAWAILKEWGGWRSEKSMERYIEDARRRIAEKASIEHLHWRYSRSNPDGKTQQSSHA